MDSFSLDVFWRVQIGVILYMHTFLLHTLSTQVRKSILLVSVFWYAIISFQIYGLDKKKCSEKALYLKSFMHKLYYIWVDRLFLTLQACCDQVRLVCRDWQLFFCSTQCRVPLSWIKCLQSALAVSAVTISAHRLVEEYKT